MALPFPLAESIMINHALCATDKFSLTPITDDVLHHKVLMSKFQVLNSELAKKLLFDYGFVKDIKTDMAAVDIIQESVPMLYGANTTDLLEFRDKNKEALERFKTEIGRLVTEAGGNFWDEDFHKKMVDVIDAKVKPSLQELRDSVESTEDKFARVLREGAQLTSLPLLAKLVPGCDPVYGVMASAGVLALQEYLHLRKNRRTICKNSFAFLLEAQRRFR